MGFKNLDTYCVAPVTVRGVPLASYEFWAVGLGCCSSGAADFHCGDYGHPSAHSGLRLLREDQADYFRLAVRMAESAYGIKTRRPLFFLWTRDAEQAMDTFRDEGYKYYVIGMLV